MSKYDYFLKKLKEDHRTTAETAIRQLYLLLKEDDPNLSNEDIYDRILKDCLTIWARATIIANMPEELKDKERQESGKRGAEEKKKQQLMVTHDGNVASVDLAKSSSVEQKEQEFKTLAQQTPLNKNDTYFGMVNKEVEECPISTIDHPASSSSNNENLLPFEFSLPVRLVLGSIVPLLPKKKEDDEERMWFSGVLNKSTGEVISATVGRRTASHDDTFDDSDR
jgi:hypothetical protein